MCSRECSHVQARWQMAAATEVDASTSTNAHDCTLTNMEAGVVVFDIQLWVAATHGAVVAAMQQKIEQSSQGSPVGFGDDSPTHNPRSIRTGLCPLHGKDMPMPSMCVRCTSLKNQRCGDLGHKNRQKRHPNCDSDVAGVALPGLLAPHRVPRRRNTVSRLLPPA